MANVVEQGDLFFAFRRRVGAAHVHDLRDVQRFYIVLGTHEPQDQFRVLIVGRKHLPEPGVEPVAGLKTSRQASITRRITTSTGSKAKKIAASRLPLNPGANFGPPHMR